jgi:hypothetical protein
MGAILIAFPATRTRAYRSTRTKKSPSPDRRHRPQLRVQVERITALLEELDDLSGASIKVPSAMLTQACASTSKLKQSLGSRDVAQPMPPMVEVEGDPQPHVDREVLERLYDSLDPYQ